MKNIINQLNKAFENRIRLGIMSSLMVNDELDFNTLKELLDSTDGNLSSHVSALEKADYLIVKKSFSGKKPQTHYSLTSKGRKAFSDHIEALGSLINNKT